MRNNCFFLFCLLSAAVFAENVDNSVYVNSIAPDRGLADPHVLIVNDTLYCMCGHDKTWNTVDFCRMDRWELWASTDLKDWKYMLKILPTDTYIGNQDNCWAGDLAEKDGKFYWYFSNKFHNTGVMVAPTMLGPWKDALGKPLLPTGIINGKPYDPEIFVENGDYYIIFGAGQYYISKLGSDMISLATEPEKLDVIDSTGKKRPVADKPCMFKRNGIYYLTWGNKYAMSESLKGPYRYIGDFMDGGHGSVFEWKGQWYTIQENHETNAFYRGIQLRPLYFNGDNTVLVPENNFEYPLPGRIYDFKHSTQGWRSEKGSVVKRKEEFIYGKAECKGAIVASTPFLHTPIYLCNHIKIRMSNLSGAKTLKIALNSYDMDRGFTKNAPKKVDWDGEEWITVPLKNDTGMHEYKVDLSKFKKLGKYLHQIAVQPVSDLVNSDWMIEDIIIE